MSDAYSDRRNEVAGGRVDTKGAEKTVPDLRADIARRMKEANDKGDMKTVNILRGQMNALDGRRDR